MTQPMAVQQLPLFKPVPIMPAPPPLVMTPGPLTAGSSLIAALGAFHEHMIHQGFSLHTIKAFDGDLNIFRKYLGAARAVGQITTEEISKYLTYLRFERGIPCNPKSYQRRLTSLKVFFSWLTRQHVIEHDPAAPIPHLPVTTPLPEILYAQQVTKLLDTTRAMMLANRSDARPYLLVSLLLTTGIKKSECMAIRLNDIDLSDHQQPVLYIRYADPRRRHKERKLKLPRDFADSLARYCEQYQPREFLFECTSRNLEYILTDVAEQANLGAGVSFEGLRWTGAVRDYVAGMPGDVLRQKLGLSNITWQETGDRIKRLAAKAL